MASPSPSEIAELVQTTMIELFAPSAFVNEAGQIGLAIGNEYKGMLTCKELETAAEESAAAFIQLIKDKVGGKI